MSAFLCVAARESMCMCVSVCTCCVFTCVCKCRPEADVGCLPGYLSILFFLLFVYFMRINVFPEYMSV